MFREVITVKWKDTYTAKKIPLSKEISNVSNSYHIRIQAYQLEQKINSETVFILQLKHTRNVRNVGSTNTNNIGISMHNQYRMDMGAMSVGLITRSSHSLDSRRRHIRTTESRKRSSSSFFDQIWLQHKSKAFLHATVNTIFRAFDCDDFIQYNEHTNQFEFNFQAKQNMTTLTKYVSLSRTQYTKEEAETLLKDRHHAFETIKPCKVQVCCVNSHEIEDKDWDFEVNLALLPGKYEFYIDELFGKVPTQIHARDYPRIRQFYDQKLKEFVRKAKIFDKYLRHLSTFEPRYKMMEWSKNGVESGPLFGLYSILCEVADKDDIWDNLFEICLRDKIDDKIIRNSISEQTVADFIALSLKHYVKDSVKRRIQYRETQKNAEKENKESKEKEKDNKKHKNKEGLDTYILSESDRYILSIILPYFGSPPLKSIHKSVSNESLTSGLFNHFSDPLQIENIAPADDDDDAVDINNTEWCMKVPPMELKNNLLRHLSEKGYDVVKQYYLAVYQHVPAVEKGDKTRWTFYIRPSTYSEIYNGQHKINMNAYTFYDKFEFETRNMSSTQYLNLIIKCVDVSFECDWAMWTKKKLRLYTASLGYWKLLSAFDDNPRVLVDHLDCMLALLRHDSMSISPKLLRNENQYLSVVFLKEKNRDSHGFGMDSNLKTQGNNINQWTEHDVEAEYQLTYWNGKKTGNSSLSLKLIKAAIPAVDEKKALKTRDSHFIHYRSEDRDIKWLWYDNDEARYKSYVLGCEVPKQLEATYQGVSEEVFPLDQFKRDTKSDAKERIFNCSQIPDMSTALVKRHGLKWKPFVLRFTFHKHGTGKIINIEQLAINSYYDQFPRNVKRVYSGKSGVMINDEEQRVSSLGEMNIYQSNKSIIICWKFEQNNELGIFKTYHYKVQIAMKYETKFKRLLDCWRTNTLFDQSMTNRSMSIVQSRMWKTDHKMPQIRDITREDEVAHKEEAKDVNNKYKNSDDEEYDDDDKDEEKQSKPNKKDEECIPCMMIESNNEEELRRRRLAHAHQGSSDTEEDNGIPPVSPPDAAAMGRQRSQSSAQLARIEKYSGLYKSTPITDSEWDLFDALDDKQRETSNLMKQKPVYKLLVQEAGAEGVFDEWKKRHAPHKFRKQLYKLVSLTFVQSIISVMKHHANGVKHRDKPLIIVISNAQKMFNDIFSLHETDDYRATNSKCLSHLFDAKDDIKRIDSKGHIYSIAIGDKLQKEIICSGYLHEFVSMTSIKYKETLVLFTRNESENIYISHNGYISKLSLALHDEDLHYFLPLFIPLKVGDCVKIEAFSSPDNGTIVSLWRNNEKNNIMYRIRSSENVYYIMNYYKLVNRAAPKVYWYETRKNVIKHAPMWNGLKLWKTEETKDPSDPSHPLHGVILALVESSKQAIASIECRLREIASGKDMEAKKCSIQHKLQNTGCIFLFYKSVEVENKSEEVLEFERQEEEKERDGEGQGAVMEEDEDDYDCNLQESNPNGLSHLIKFLKRNKLICNVQDCDDESSYDLFCGKALGILRQDCSNRVYVCHMIENKSYVLQDIESDALGAEEAMDIGGATGADDDAAMDIMSADPDDDDEWLTLEPEEDDEPRRQEVGTSQRVVIRSSFKCLIRYSFEMCCVQRRVLTVEDIMMMKKDKSEWTTEDHKLLTQFHAHNIWNKFDLLDKQLISSLKSQLTPKLSTNGHADNKLKLLSKKFTEFTESVDKLLCANNIESPLNQYVIAGVEVTRNAKLLREYIDSFRRYRRGADDDTTAVLDDGDVEIIESNNDRCMIVAYNPIQTVVVTSCMIKDVTHPIHLYRAAYDEKLYPRHEIGQLNAEWMQTQTKNANIINALSTLLRYNKKYEIILVPSSIHLSRDNFLSSRCEMVAPEHEAIADYRITFLYKGLLYRYDKKKAKEYKEAISLSIVNNPHDAYDDLDMDGDDDDDKIFVDEIKFLLRLLHDNICEEEPDAMDPDEAVFAMSSSTHKQIETGNTSTSRLRATIKRKHTDRIFRWLNIGCGSCFLHEISGRSKEIGPKKGTDYEKEFPRQLQRAMFEYYIDCRVPFNEEIISVDSQCAICKQLMIDPATIGNKECQHIFCKLCIQQWYYVSPQINNNQNNNNGNGLDIAPPRNMIQQQRNTCPICRRGIKEIWVQKESVAKCKKGIPTTIYQQIMEENQSRYLRQHLVDDYITERERVLEAEQSAASNLQLGQQMRNNPRLQNQLAGY